MMKYRLVIISCLLLNLSLIQAQDLETETVEVVKNFEARLGVAQKVKLEPELFEAEMTERQFDYNVQEKMLTVEYLPPTIRAISMRTEELSESYNGFAKAGFGYPLSPYLDAGYLYESSTGSNFLARVSHHSANDKNVENQRFSDSDVLLKGTYITEQGFSVDGHAAAELNQYSFYGYPREDTTFTKDDVLNRINVFSLGAKLYNSTETIGKLNYWAGFDAYQLSNNFATRETGLNLDLGLTKWFGENPLTIALGTDLTRLKDTSIQKLNTFFVNPTFSFGTHNVRIQFGARMETSNEMYYFYPDVELLINLAGNNLSVFAGADGGLRKNNFRILSDYNPFMVSELSDIRVSSYYDFYGGIKGIVSGLEYSFQGGFKPTDDLALFEVDQEKPWTRYDVVYDTASIIYFKGAVKGKLFPKVDISGSVVYNIYDLNNQEKAWYLPKLQTNVGVTYLTMDQRLRLKAETYVTDPVEFQDLDLPDEPNLLMDVSLSADYYLTENFGVFIHLNNLAANKYRRWYSYPNFGLNVLGGITARF